MPKMCNIDGRGRVARLIWGLLLVVVGAVLAGVWAWPAGSWMAWTVCALVVAAGLFAVYEARAGWCVMRAMGFKTPM